MNMEYFTIDGIPAVLWGEPSDRVFVAVHGNMSHKTDAVISLLAEAAQAKGFQTLSLDLPEHGDRREEGTPCKAQYGVRDVSTVMDRACSHWSHVSLFGCSMGAYFGLLACRERSLKQALFLSPVVDMKRLTEGMMASFGITPAMLEEREELDTPVGQKLYWDDYLYITSHPVNMWSTPTAILRGELDDLCDAETVSGFAKKFGCRLDSLQGAGHFFHTPEELACYRNWLDERLSTVA